MQIGNLLQITVYSVKYILSLQPGHFREALEHKTERPQGYTPVECPDSGYGKCGKDS
ncbi:hypothetical protein Desti_4329 [Desulfomonile tiedjei DSM 6799]|uniref:Uncharacterized protein n=1 Tax=Desulfomonile tiedjei (strain ATCC 49306 / DSM 6799 / DCB-1) TaxID=706587 RepID=I4CBM1_DESTA|nr:hypothetical protein Desti_4329 [Desulfomonile tiedjei DSM 6799]